MRSVAQPVRFDRARDPDRRLGAFAPFPRLHVDRDDELGVEYAALAAEHRPVAGRQQEPRRPALAATGDTIRIAGKNRAEEGFLPTSLDHPIPIHLVDHLREPMTDVADVW